MSKQHRVIEVAKEFHMSGKEAVAILKKAGFDVKNNFSAGKKRKEVRRRPDALCSSRRSSYT